MKAGRLFRRYLLWTTAGTLGLALLAYLGLVIINWHDDPPSAAALELDRLYRERPIPAETDNAYPYLLGFTAAAGVNPSELGRTRIEWARGAVQPPFTPQLLEPERSRFIDYQAMRSPSLNALVNSCTQNEPTCAQSLRTDGNLVERWLASEQPLLERYLSLLVYRAIHEPLPYDPRLSLPDYRQILDGQRLLLIQAWQLASRGEALQVNSLLEKDLAFWRMALANADIIISKMVATTAIKQHFLWANRALRQLPAERVQSAIPDSWRQPLAPRERSMLRAFSGELAFTDRCIQLMKAGQFDWTTYYSLNNSGALVLSTLVMPFLLRQTSNNQQAQFLLDLEQAFAVPYPQIDNAIAQAKVIHDAQIPKRLNLSHLHNLTANLLNTLDSDTDYSQYLIRVTDLEGLRRAALLLAHLRSQGVAAAAVAPQMQQSELNNPYSQAPFDWAPDPGTLSFASPSRDEVYEFEY